MSRTSELDDAALRALLTAAVLSSGTTYLKVGRATEQVQEIVDAHIEAIQGRLEDQDEE